jgi:hypothetical protein
VPYLYILSGALFAFRERVANESQIIRLSKLFCLKFFFILDNDLYKVSINNWGKFNIVFREFF